jgi:hypothetical protein
MESSVLLNAINKAVSPMASITYTGSSKSADIDRKFVDVKSTSAAMAKTVDMAKMHGMKSGQIKKAISRAAPKTAVKSRASCCPGDAYKYATGKMPLPLKKMSMPGKMK